LHERSKFTCTAWTEDEKKVCPTRHGFVRVHANGPRAGRYFEYADGTPFLWIGDTWWNWTQRGIRFETFKNLVDDRAKKGFGFFLANGDNDRPEAFRDFAAILAYPWNRP